MSKTRCTLYALAVPILYFVIQVIVTSAAMIAVMVSRLGEITVIAGDEGLMELVNGIILEALEYTMTLGVISAVIFVGVMLLIHRKRNMWQDVRLVPPEGGFGFAVAMAAAAGIALNLASSALISALPLPSGMMEQYNQIIEATLGGNPVIAALGTCLIIPFAEELIFRGFTQRFLSVSMSAWMACVTQALIFGLFHGNMPQSAYAFAAAMALGMLYMWTKSLWVPIAFHIAYNTSSYGLDAALTAIYGEGEPSQTAWALMTAVGGTVAVICVHSVYKRFKPAPTSPSSGTRLP
ncbi:hypothetical protein FACS1894208_08060 [Clostridia bacterium]|nr:hypothetical protein FACS1894208_08060 [Clostridia bacterium]